MERCGHGFILPGGSVVKDPPDNAGDIRDVGSKPGWGRCPGRGMAAHSSLLVQRIPPTEVPHGSHRV